MTASSKTARVLWLMDRSFKARLDGDLDAERDALAQANTVDAELVAEVQTGIASGDVPHIEYDPHGWNRYYLDAQEREGRDAAIVKVLTNPPYKDAPHLWGIDRRCDTCGGHQDEMPPGPCPDGAS